MSKIFPSLALIFGCAAFLFPAMAQETLTPVQQIEEHRKKQNEEMKSATSPLLAKDKKRFKGLKYFPSNLEYRVNAKFIRTENAVMFKMKTTKNFRNPDYVKYGEVHFTLKGVDYVLEVYQSPDISKKEEYKDHLFIPFTDETNGHETYDVGRYLDVKIPEGDEIILDFNLCYNPYCSYNPNYACPIPPAANNLKTRIEAGEKIFKKH